MQRYWGIQGGPFPTMRIKILDGSKNSGFLQGSTVSNIRREDEGGKTNTFIVGRLRTQNKHH